MPSLLVPESIALQAKHSQPDSDPTHGGGPAVPVNPPPDPPRNVSELDPQRSPDRVGAPRLFTYFAMFWIVALFATMALVLESRWVHSPDWFSIKLPSLLYANTLILFAGSASVEFARRALRAMDAKRSARCLFLTASLGAAFLAGQVVAWQVFGLAGPPVASNPGSFFYYLITGAHGILVLAAIAFLGDASLSIRRIGPTTDQQFSLGTMAIYWHFVVGLWICLMGLPLTAIQ